GGRRPLLLAAIPLLLTACSVLYDPPPPSGTPAPTGGTPALTPVPGGSTAPSAGASSAAVSPPTQTDTEWGRIWDGLPAGFPLPPGAVPTEIGEGAASATLAVGSSGGSAGR